MRKIGFVSTAISIAAILAAGSVLRGDNRACTGYTSGCASSPCVNYPPGYSCGEYASVGHYYCQIGFSAECVEYSTVCANVVYYSGGQCANGHCAGDYLVMAGSGTIYETGCR